MGLKLSLLVITWFTNYKIFWGFVMIVKKIKPQRQFAAKLMSMAQQWEGVNLEDVYRSPSLEKITKWNEVFELHLDENGDDFHITAFSPYRFTVAWTVKEGTRVVTYKNSYLVLNGDKYGK